MKNISESKEQPLCHNCVNFIYTTTTNKIICDMDYWAETYYNEALLFVPELFDCIDFESIDNFK